MSFGRRKKSADDLDCKKFIDEELKAIYDTITNYLAKSYPKGQVGVYFYDFTADYVRIAKEVSKRFRRQYYPVEFTFALNSLFDCNKKIRLSSAIRIKTDRKMKSEATSKDVLLDLEWKYGPRATVQRYACQENEVAIYWNNECNLNEDNVRDYLTNFFANTIIPDFFSRTDTKNEEGHYDVARCISVEYYLENIREIKAVKFWQPISNLGIMRTFLSYCEDNLEDVLMDFCQDDVGKFTSFVLNVKRRRTLHKAYIS